MHLTLCLRMLRCMLVYASCYRYRPLFCASRDGISPTRRQRQRFTYIYPCYSGVGFPYSEYELCYRDFPLPEFRLRSSLMGFSPLRSTHNLDSATAIFPSWRPNSSVGIFPTRRIKLTGIVDETSATWKHNKHTKSSTH